MNKIAVYKDRKFESIAIAFYSGDYTTLYRYMGHDVPLDSISETIEAGLSNSLLISMDTDQFNEEKELLFYVESKKGGMLN